MPVQLNSLDYEAFYWNRGGVRPLDDTPIVALEDTARAKSVAGRSLTAEGYVSNFLFLHHSDEGARILFARSGLFARTTSSGPPFVDR